MVAGVRQKHGVASGLQGLLQVDQAGVAPAVLNAAVHVVREQNDHAVLRQRLLGYDGDAALAAGIGVIGGNHVVIVDRGGLLALADGDVLAGHGLDVVDENLVVQHHLVLQDRHVLQAEHGKAVALVLQHVVVGRQLVGPRQVQRLVLAGLLVQDLYVLHAVGIQTGRADPHLAVVQRHVGRQRGVDLILEAGYLQEAAVLAGADAGAHLQGVQDLLAADLHQAGRVAVGMHTQNVLKGDLARGDIRAHAAAVHKRNVGVQHVPIAVRAQVAQVRLGAAHRAGARVGILCGQRELGVGHDLLQQALILSLDAGDVRRRVGVVLHLLGRGQQLDLHAVVRDDQHAHVGKLGAGLAVEHRLAVLVVDGGVDLAVAVAVDKRVHAAHVGDDLGRGPGAGLGVDAAVAHDDDVIRAFVSRRVYRRLRGFIHALAGGVLAEAVDVLAILVLEVGRGGLGDGLRRAHADEGDRLAVHLKELVGVQHGRGGLAVHVVHEVRGDVRELSRRYILKELRHGVVELVVAGHRHVVAHVVHDLDEVGALAQGADGAALHVVAGVRQEHGVASGLQGLLQVDQAGVAPAVLNAAVHVVGEQNDHAVLRQRLLGRNPGGNLLRLGVAQLQAAVHADSAGEVDHVAHGQRGIGNRLEERHRVARVVLDGGVVAADGGDRQLLDIHVGADVRLGDRIEGGGLGRQRQALGLLIGGAAQLRQVLVGGVGAGADQGVAQGDVRGGGGEEQANAARLVLHIDVLAVHQGDDALDGELAAGSGQHVTDGGNGHRRGLGGLRLVGGGGRLGGIRGLAVCVQLPDLGGTGDVGVDRLVAAPVGPILSRGGGTNIAVLGTVVGLEVILLERPGSGSAADPDAVVVVDHIQAAVGSGDGVGAVLLGRDRPAVVGRAAKRQRGSVRRDSLGLGAGICCRRCRQHIGRAIAIQGHGDRNRIVGRDLVERRLRPSGRFLSICQGGRHERKRHGDQQDNCEESACPPLLHEVTSFYKFCALPCAQIHRVSIPQDRGRRKEKKRKNA